MSDSSNPPIVFTHLDPSPDDDIYIDCQPVDERNTTISDSNSEDDGIINNEILTDLSNTEFNIFQNTGIHTLLAVGIFAVILVSGNYVFNKLPASRLQKAIDKDRFS